MFKSWTASQLDHAIACADRAPDGLAHTKHGSFTAAQLRRARPPTFPLPPFSTYAAFHAQHSRAPLNDIEQLIHKLFGSAK